MPTSILFWSVCCRRYVDSEEGEAMEELIEWTNSPNRKVIQKRHHPLV
jgi:hypothetical protein